MARRSNFELEVLSRIGTKSKRLPTGRASGRTRGTPGQMNKLEAEYSLYLETRNDVIWYKYDAIKLRLAKDTFYVPDFLVMLDTNELQVHEVKGHWEDDARVKIKVAAEMYPFAFVAITRPKGGSWEFEVIAV